MAKKEKIVDLKPKAEKVTDEHLTKIQNLVNNINRMQLEIGMTEVRKAHMLNNVSVTQTSLQELQEELKRDYGTIDIDIQTGFINYPENGETDKKD